MAGDPVICTESYCFEVNAARRCKAVEALKHKKNPLCALQQQKIVAFS